MRPLPAPVTRSLLRLAGLISLVLGGPAVAVDYNIGDVQVHGDWHSLTLSLGEERHLRAMEGHSYRDTVFSVNATPGACDRPWLELRVELGEFQAESATHNVVPADLLIDQGWVHQGRAEFITGRGDSGFYARFSIPDTASLLNELRRGDVLRLRLHRAEDDPWFLVFSLDGADAALARMAQLCATSAD